MRAPRRAGIGDERVVREVRLRALAEAPDDLAGLLDEERRWTMAEWREWIGEGGLYVLEVDDVPRGMAAGVPHWTDPHAAFLMSMWVEPALRGTGAAEELVTAVVSWAEEERGAVVLWLHVDPRNERARRFYRRMGFRETGREVPRERDGRLEVEMRRPLRARPAPPARRPGQAR